MPTNPWTGKAVDKASDLLPREINETCDVCGTKLIENCLVCGAPVCCPKCCREATEESRKECEPAAINLKC